MSSWGAGVLHRLMTPGALLAILGAVIAFASGWISRRLLHKDTSQVSVVVKGIGCLIAIVGAILLFTM